MVVLGVLVGFYLVVLSGFTVGFDKWSTFKVFVGPEFEPWERY